MLGNTMQFDTEIAVAIRGDLEIGQKLNVASDNRVAARDRPTRKRRPPVIYCKTGALIRARMR
jgi:hypothetical protein